MKFILFAFIILMISLSNGRAEAPTVSQPTMERRMQVAAKEDKGSKTETIYIQTDLPPPAEAEEVMPTHPFFASPSAASEVLQKVQELEERVEKLEKTVSDLKTAKH